MGDLIERTQALNAINIAMSVSGAWENVVKLPSAQPQRKTGKWITVEGRFGNEVECNQCHSVFWYWMGNYRFCPSCGADMRGESDE